MARKEVKHAWVANDSARGASLKKRRLGLLKKVRELATLCGVKAGVIIYSPKDNELVVWPSHAEVQELLVSFHNMPELKRLKMLMNLETYQRGKVTKGQELQMKYQRRNEQIEIGHFMHQIDQGKRLDELQGLTWLAEKKMKAIRKHTEFFQQVPFAQIIDPYHEDLPFPSQGPIDDLTARIGNASSGLRGDERTRTGSLLWDKWFIDLMNNNKLKAATSSSSIRSDKGLPYLSFASRTTDNLELPRHSFGGSLSVAADMGLPRYMNFRGTSAEF